MAASYQRYMQSEGWQRVRARILKRANDRCEKCKKATAKHVHHKTYVRLGAELDSDLIAVCVPCHQKEHPDKIVLHPSFTIERPCRMCPGESAEVFMGKLEALYICAGCGNLERQARKPKRQQKPKKARQVKERDWSRMEAAARRGLKASARERFK